MQWRRMDENFGKSFEQAAAFQKMWMDSISKMQAAFSTPTMAPPSEFLQQMRSGIFRALGQSWDEFMRSPQFLEGMKQWMEQAIQFRNSTNNFFGKLRNEVPAASSQDVDDCLLTIQHVENRMCDRMENFSNQLRALSEQVALMQKGRAAKKQAAKPKRAPAAVAKRRKKRKV